jgi:hypothetical protein
MIVLLGLVLSVLTASFKSKSRLEAENAVRACRDGRNSARMCNQDFPTFCDGQHT